MPKREKQDVWGALADGTRREILLLLFSRPHTAGELADQFELTAATVSHHLAVLRECGLCMSSGARRRSSIRSLRRALRRSPPI